MKLVCKYGGVSFTRHRVIDGTKVTTFAVSVGRRSLTLGWTDHVIGATWWKIRVADGTNRLVWRLAARWSTLWLTAATLCMFAFWFESEQPGWWATYRFAAWSAACLFVALLNRFAELFPE